MDGTHHVQLQSMTGSLRRRLSAAEGIAEAALEVMRELLEGSREGLEEDELNVLRALSKQVIYRQEQAQQRTFYYFTERTPDEMLRRYLQLTGITNDETKDLQRMMQERENGLDLSSWVVQHSTRQKRAMSKTEIQSPEINNKGRLVSRSPSDELRYQEEYRQMLKRIKSEKEQIQHKRLDIEKVNGERINQKLKEEETLMEEVRNLKKSKIKQRLEYQRILRSKKEEQRKAANEAYMQFIREYHQVRPLHEVREMEFKMKEEMKLRDLEDQRRSRINTLLKPLSSYEFEQHERKYLEEKRRIERQLVNRRVQNTAPPPPKRDYFRGRSHQIVLEQHSRQNIHEDKDAALQRIRQYYENILKKLHKPVRKSTGQEKELVPEEPPPVDRKERIKSLGDEYLVFNKQRRRTQVHESIDSTLALHTQPSSPHVAKNKLSQSLQKGTHETQRRPPVPLTQHRRRPKPVSIRDHYDVESLIYQNSRKDELIRRVEELSHFHHAAELDDLELKYIDSIREKLDILNSLS